MLITARIFKNAPSNLFLGSLVAIGLYISSRYNYLFFHSLVELFSVLTAFAIFVLAWNTRRINDNHYLLFIGIASLFTGALGLLHTIAFKGMGVFPDRGANLATELWIAFRFLFSVTFLLAGFFIVKKPDIKKTFILYMIVLCGLILSIFKGWFPDCYTEGKGLTAFKIASEYVICIFFLASLTLLVAKRRSFNPLVIRLIVLSLVFSIAAEISFTEYVSVYGFFNMLGHLFLLASVGFIYRAVVVTGLVEPSELLFRNLKQSEKAIRASEAKYRRLFENMTNGFAYHKIVTDEKSVPVDYIFLEVNNAFETMTGLKRSDILGKTIREVLPGIDNDPADWISTYGEVALKGRETRFEQFSESLGRWYSVSAYSPLIEHFVTIFEDITERKRIEEELQRAHDQLELRVKERTGQLVQANEELENEITVRWMAEKELRESEERFRTSVENLLDGFAIFSSIRDDEGRIADFRFEYINQAGCHLNRKSRAEQVGRNLLHLLPSHMSTGLFHRYVQVVESGEPLAVSNLIQENPGNRGPLGQSFDLQAVKLGDGFVVIWRDVSERRETERRAALTNELLKLYTRKFTRKEYLDVAVELIRGWSGCHHIGVRIADRDGNIPYESCAGYDPEFLSAESMLSLKSDRCVCIRVVAGEREPSGLLETTPNGSVFSNDTGRLVDAMSDEELASYRAFCMRRGFMSVAVVPIRNGETILGAIHAADERPGMVPAKKVEFLEQLAYIIGEALFRFGVEEDLVRRGEELVRTNEQLRNLTAHVDAVREGERTSIAREIHDELGQILTAIKMDVSWLRGRLRAADGKLSEKTEETIKMIDSALQSVKRISAELRPGILDDIGLAAAVDWAAGDFQKRTGITCTVYVHPEGMIVDRTRSTALFRILQESLTNIIRHARASNVSVLLEKKDGRIVLTVRDDGRGIRQEDISDSHSFGLIGMRERVQFLKGDVSISGVRNGGTTVTVTLPVDSGKETEHVH